MPSIRSNRDLYRTVTEALRRRGRVGPSLELYLTRLREVLLESSGDLLSADAFAAALDGAFEDDPAPIDDASLQALADAEAAAGWHRQLARQLLDLREMAAAGTLDEELRYYGVDAPSGARWYNFDPHAFVECALSGTFGGWEADEGAPVTTLQTVDWDAVAAFLRAGQQYE